MKFVFAAILLALSTIPARAAVPAALNFQGVALDEVGDPPVGPIAVGVRIWAAIPWTAEDWRVP